MNIKEMLGTLPKKEKRQPLAELSTSWGQALDPKHVLEAYPRPRMRRPEYEILNGYWQYAITDSGKYPGSFDGRILVPFSPESQLSGVKRQLRPDAFLWYERAIHIPDHTTGFRRLLHFEAVDQCACIYINGHFVRKHVGGYLPFSVDLTPFLQPGSNTLRLTVRVQDFSDASYHSRGKQKLSPGGMYYTAQSGIWQTVWMETVPDHYMTALDLTADPKKGQVRVTIGENLGKAFPDARVKIWDAVILADDEKDLFPCAGEPMARKIADALTFTLDLPSPKKWTPETPYLYPVEITAGKDTVRSYFAMRDFQVETDAEGLPRICLDHKAIFLNGVLDQGYWPDGLYTAPSDEALIYDIRMAKELGFNMIRKHAKIECRRWYYHCDRLGMIVWQDMVNGGSAYSPLLLTYLPTLLCVPGPTAKTARSSRVRPALSEKLEYRLTGRSDPRGRLEFSKEVLATVKLLKGFPSIMAWVLFNEGWGQFDTRRLTRLLRHADPSRLIDSASGWFDHREGDIKSVHNYFYKLAPVKDARPYVLSEYGGYVCHIKEHSATDTTYGYRDFRSPLELEDAFCRLILDDLPPLIRKGLCGAVYTQLTDIEEETNGLLTYDRRVCKISPSAATRLRKERS